MPKEDMTRKPGESLDAYLKRVRAYMKKHKSVDWGEVEMDIGKIVKEIRRKPDKKDVITIESEQKRRDKIKKIFKKKKKI